MHKGRRQVLSRRRRMTQVLLVLNGSGLMNSNVESSLQSGRRCTMQATFNSVDLTNIDQRSTRLGEERHGSYATLLLLGCKGLSVRSLTKWEVCWKWSRVRNQYCFFFFFYIQHHTFTPERAVKDLLGAAVYWRIPCQMQTLVRILFFLNGCAVLWTKVQK